MKNRERDEKGLTILESLVSLFLVSIALLSFYLVIYETNRIDSMSKEHHFVEQLVRPYLDYYMRVDVTQDKVNVFLSDVQTVDLTSKMRKDGSLPKAFRDLHVKCMNNPKLLDNKKYIEFEIMCEVNNKKLNKGNPFRIKRFIDS